MIVELCECHPRKNVLGIRILTDRPYEHTLNIPAAGKVCFRLPRPMKGFHDHGWYLILHGIVLTWAPMRGKAE
jgi:hypothetical protein